MALDKLTLLDETIINTTATTVATNVVNNSAQTNYISFPVATSNPLTNGWRVYSDGASHSPVDGTGGSPNSTLTQNTTPPVLNSTGDFRLTKNSGASRQGEGISTDFTIASRHLGKLLQISFDYEIIGATTLATDDLRVYIIQNPSGTPVVIEPVNVSIQETVTGVRLRHIATFQTDISITSYRLCIHIKTTTNSAQTIDFNNFRVWEPTQSIGSIITDWQSYSATINGVSVSSSSYRWRRSGGSVEISGSFTFSSQSGGDFQIPLPSGLSISSIVDRKTILGKIHLAKASFDSSNPQWFLVGITGTSYLTLAVQSNNANNLLTNYSSASTGASSGDIFTFFASVPIAGWGSSVAMSSDSNEGRVVAAIYKNHVGSLDASNGFQWSTRIIDTHNAVSVVSNRTVFTAPIEGVYSVKAFTLANNSGFCYIYKNGFLYGAIGDTGTSTSYGNFVSGEVNLLAGETIYIRTMPMTVSTIANADGLFSIFRVSAGSQIMAQTETVACSYRKTANETLSAGSSYTFQGLNFDTHGAWVTNTFTAPMSGIYQVIVVIGINSTNDWFELWVNGSFYQRSYKSNSSETPQITQLIRLNAGGTIQIRPLSNSTVLTGSTPTNGDTSFINIHRIGI